MILRFAPVVLLAALAACQSVGVPVGENSSLVRRCTDASGFTARATAARSAGVEGEVLATPQELAAVNACVDGAGTTGGPQTVHTQSRPQAQTYKPKAGASAQYRTRPRQCSLEMVGGSAYACARR